MADTLFSTLKPMRKYQYLKERLSPFNVIDYLVAFVIIICLLVAGIFIVLPRILFRH